jgi:amino-acid N-acetyltransferase
MGDWSTGALALVVPLLSASGSCPSVQRITLRRGWERRVPVAGYGDPVTIQVRRARTADVRAIKELVDSHAGPGLMLAKAAVTLYEDVQEFVVAEQAGRILGAGALHVLWEDLAEVRTMAVADDVRGAGIGSRLLEALLDRARELGVRRVVCLTFATGFFAAHGFRPAEDVHIEVGLFRELVQSTDEGVAEFLDLDRVRPNTLGNTRMLLTLDAA